MTALYGWCLDRRHEQCPGRTCACQCHANADEARDCQGEWSLDVADHLDLDHYTKGASE